MLEASQYQVRPSSLLIHDTSERSNKGRNRTVINYERQEGIPNIHQ